MAITREDETDLLTALHEGPLEQPLWSTFLTRLRLRAGADHVSLQFRRADAAPEDVISLFSGGPSSIGNRNLRDQLSPLDNAHTYQQLRLGRVYAADDLIDLAGAPHPATRGEAMVGNGWRDMRVIRIGDPNGYNVWLTIARENALFSGTETALLSALAPHFAIALRNFAAIERERIRAGIAADAIRRLNFGWLTLDSGGRVVDCDSQAERLLRNSQILVRSARGRLMASSPQADRALGGALRAFVADSDIRPRVVHLSDEPWLDMLLVPMRERAISGAVTPILIAYVHGDERSSADRRDQLAQLFDLTPSEAALAVALSRGKSIAEAAIELNLTIETARNYSKKIYAKTGARGQPDLIRLILASVIALA
jgi:DNA-binding CsgD family transcriptional regulator